MTRPDQTVSHSELRSVRDDLEHDIETLYYLVVMAVSLALVAVFVALAAK